MIGAQSKSIKRASGVRLQCVRHCNAFYIYTPIVVTSYCIGYSIPLDITVGQVSNEIDLAAKSYFMAAHCFELARIDFTNKFNDTEIECSVFD